ncbi:MAG TPA: contractile injection system tape measure protein, partial [Chitinophagaceae bacterium]|nr:contractile injection system tape measure protein [Chitinophagaceae bacterium]
TESKQAKQNAKKPPELPEDCIYINNGGLAILHPFLQPLCSALGLLDSDNRFIDEPARHKACVVIYYLQSGTDLYAEEEMAFNKILCGMAIEDVLPAEISLNDTDKKECNELLDAVIDYWDALKGASAAALQETFIRRSARLSFKNDHWLLQVERNATDILTDRLPWGIGIIKLPWLSHLIHTEW